MKIRIISIAHLPTPLQEITINVLYRHIYRFIHTQSYACTSKPKVIYNMHTIGETSVRSHKLIDSEGKQRSHISGAPECVYFFSLIFDIFS